MADTVPPDLTSEERFLTFRSEGSLYALPASSVSGVVRMQPIARVPLSPRGLMGLANLRGSVIPVASVRALLGRQEIASTASARLIVLDDLSRVALAVDEVSDLVRVKTADIKTNEADIASDKGEHLQGVFENGAKITKILDVPALLRVAFAKAEQNNKVVVAAAVEDQKVEIPRQRLMTLEVASQEYALPLDAVKEILPLPDGLTVVPGSDGAVRGVIPYRASLLPLLSLRVLLGLPPAVLPREKVLVVVVGGVHIGFVADRTHTVLSVDPALVEPVPTVLSARAGGEAQIKEIYRAGDGRLVSILAAERLLKEEVMKKLVQNEFGAKTSDQRDASARSDDLCFLVFRLDGSDFALSIDAVEEVARVPDQVTRLPKTPKFLEGVVNLRGEVLPVIDQRRRFDMPPSDGSAGRRLVVVRTERYRAGLIVDGVSEVLRCSPDAIQATPEMTGDSFALVKSVISLEAKGSLILLLDPAELLTQAERGLLDSLDKDHRPKETRQPSK